MSKVFFAVSIILIVVWAIGFFEFHKRGLIHILLAIAVIILIERLLYNKSIMKF
jgi:low affinity Fe/Cu permease